MRECFFGIAVSTFFAMGTGAAMACAVTDATLTGSTLAYNPFAAAEAVETYDLVLTTDGNCGQLIVQALFPSSGDGRPANLPFIILTDNVGNTVFYSNASGSPGSFVTRSTTTSDPVRTLTYYVQTDADQAFLTPVSETGVPIRFQVTEMGSTEIEIDLNRDVSVEVVPHLSAHFAGTSASGATHTLDLGVLSRDATTEKMIGIALETNVNYTIAFSSLKNGMLEIKDDDRVTTAWQIPYALEFDDDIVTFNAAETPTTPVALDAPLDGTPSHRLSVEVAPAAVGKVRAGTYSDTITVTIAQRN